MKIARENEIFLTPKFRSNGLVARNLFTPCAPVNSLLKAVTGAAKFAVAGDMVLFSPACSSLDRFRDFQHRDEVYRKAVKELARATKSGGDSESTSE